MNTIRNYINAMFSSLPRTPEMLRLQAEMLENMEDKFHDLLAEGKSEEKAVGIILSSIGSAEDLRRDLELPELPADETYHSEQMEYVSFQEEYHVFRRKFAFAIAGGVALCILGIILGTLTDEFIGIDGITVVSFFIPIAAAVAIFVYWGICEDSFEKHYQEQVRVENNKTHPLSNLVSSILFPFAALVYVFIGLRYGWWHPGWIIFPICSILVGGLKAFEEYNNH